LLRLAAGGLAFGSLSACSYTPSSVENRPRLPSCGQYENLNQPPSADQRRKNRCILNALANGRRAELVVTHATIEGDPITEYLRVVGPDRVEAFVDATRDSEAGPEARWSHWLCRGLEEQGAYLNTVDCREISADERVT
jgi:hypothetical protein